MECTNILCTGPYMGKENEQLRVTLVDYLDITEAALVQAGPQCKCRVHETSEDRKQVDPEAWDFP